MGKNGAGWMYMGQDRVEWVRVYSLRVRRVKGLTYESGEMGVMRSALLDPQVFWSLGGWGWGKPLAWSHSKVVGLCRPMSHRSHRQ